jgi:2-amino-4-hydroxy-6-hydroxymethyldihydropteridine diphosphokinase
MPRSLIALGSNLGDRQHALRRAVEILAAHPAISNVSASSLHETAPVGGAAGQGPFLNAAVALDTSLAPEALHKLLRHTEAELGRRPGPRWAARPIDLDLLLFDNRVINTPTLSVPHPRMAFRRFVLAPSAQVAPDMTHPLIGWSVGRLLAHLDSAAPYVAILGTADSGKASLAREVAQTVGGSYLAEPGDDTSAEAADPSGRAQRRPIQFLDRAAEVLRRYDWRATTEVVVSDFFFDECLAYARLALDDAEYRQFVETWAEASKTVVAPKLLVALDTWERGIAVWQQSQASSPAVPRVPRERLPYELLLLAGHRNQGPVLYAGNVSCQVRFDEITAAIAAMK